MTATYEDAVAAGFEAWNDGFTDGYHDREKKNASDFWGPHAHEYEKGYKEGVEYRIETFDYNEGRMPSASRS